MMCNSILISPLDRFCCGTGGTGGTTQDLVRAGGTAEGYRWDRRAQGGADRTKRHHGGPTGPTKSLEISCSTTGTTGPTR
jgi:hypothetical protein